VIQVSSTAERLLASAFNQSARGRPKLQIVLSCTQAVAERSLHAQTIP
jgi:hypothetical protein